MNDIQPDNSNEVICHCSGTTRKRIEELLASDSDNLDIISRKTGACSGCGACEDSILHLIAEHKI